MIPLVLASIVMVGIILERFWTLRRSAVIPAKLGAEVRAWARSAKIERDHLEKLRTNSPLGAILAAVVAHRQRSREVIREAAEDTGRQVVHRLNKYLNALGTIATISPLLGLLGTVSGLIRMFLVITTAGIGDANALAGGIGEALVATATGLVVAIVAYLFHRYFRGRVLDLAVDMEREASMLIDSLEHAPEAAGQPVRAVR
ncbi:MAG: MotA/TolQ/ExbB proton channel family protein [Rhodanobacteraceae bacterium]|nr:MotA/TolQ/ExbB proton channel family protein [Rhodanobacteraceae bacterium]